MKRSVLSLCFSVLFISGVAFAEDTYQAEITASYLSIEEDNSNVKITTPALEARYHFSDINTSGHPLNEAAFLEHAGFIGVGISEGDYEEPGFEGDVSITMAAAVYIIPDSLVLIGMDYLKMDKETLSGKVELDQTTLYIGKYLSDTFLLELMYGPGEIDSAGSIIDTDELGIAAKYVIKKGDGTACNLEAAIISEKSDDGTTKESNTIFSVSGDHYFNDRLNVGLGYEINSGDDAGSEGNTLLLEVKNFFTKTISAEIYYEKFSADNSAGDDYDALAISLAARF